MSAETEIARYLSNRVAERLYPVAVVTPEMHIGVSFHHMKYAGTLSLWESTFIEYAYDVARSLKHHGLNFVVFLNGHFGNINALAVASSRIRQELGVRAITVTYDLLFPADGTLDTTDKLAKYGVGGEAETSMLMAINERAVRTDKLKRTGKFTMDPEMYQRLLQADDQFTIFDVASEDGLDYGNPERSTATKGRGLIEYLVDKVTDFISDILKAY